MSGEHDALASVFEGRYTLGRLLGEGATGKVFLAEDLRHHRPVAIKILRPESDTDSGRARFRREIQILASLRHPHVLPLLDSGDAGGFHYLVTPFIDGETLRQRLDRDLQLPIDEAIRIAGDVAQGLSMAHGLGLVHRDVKPSNIILSDGHAIVADFGVARVIADGEQRLSSSGMIIGTPVYMSPEQVSGEREVDGRSDIYALGCVVYEMLAGDPPFMSRRLATLIAKHVMEPPPDLTVARSSVPVGVANAVVKALSKSPADRHSDALDFAKDLVDGASLTRANGAAGIRARHKSAYRSLLNIGGWILVTAAVISLAWAVATSGPAVRLEDRPLDVVVIAYVPPSASAEERAALIRAEDELTAVLSGWDGVRAVSRAVLAAARVALGLAEADVLPLSDALRLARAVDATTLVSIENTRSGEGSGLSGQRYNVETGKPVGAPLLASTRSEQDKSGMAPIAAALLDFPTSSFDVITLKRETTSLSAARALATGMQQLADRRLERSESSIREAIDADSLFARAHHALAVNLYWQGSGNPLLFESIGGEMRRHMTQAMRGTGAMPDRDSVAVEAFNAFVNGDYDLARQRYGELLQTDSADVFAWVHLGAVEYEDPWALTLPDGSVRPRGNWTLASSAFTRAMRIAPDFDLGFGQLFTLSRRIATAAERNICYGYQTSGDGVALFWEAAGDVYLCPVFADSLVFVPRGQRPPMSERLAGASLFLDRSRVALERWAQFAPESHWPLKGLAESVISRASLQVSSGSRAAPIDLLSSALRYAERSLLLNPDTLPEDLVQVADVRLAMGDRKGAVDAVNRAMLLAVERGQPTSSLPATAANPMIATGRVDWTLEFMIDPARARSERIPDGDGVMLDVLGLNQVTRISVFGSTGYRGPGLSRAFAELNREWIDAGYTAGQIATLREYLTPRVLPALVSSPELAREWFDGWRQDDPLAAAIAALAVDDDQVRAFLERARELQRAKSPDRGRNYLAGLLAERLGQYAEAVIDYAAVGSAWPLRGGVFEADFGLSSLAELGMGRSLEALSDTTSAIEHYQRFADAWSEADPSVALYLREALEALDRLRGG